MDDFATGFIAGQSDNNGNCNNGGMWGDNGWLAIILFAIIFGWGNGGWGGGFGNNGGGYVATAATQADIQRGFDTSNTFSKLEGINNGLCDGFYAVNTSMLNGFHGVDNAVCSLGNAMQQGFNATQVAMMQGQNALQAQISDCCCRTNNNIERGFADVGYRMATDTCAIQTAMANNTRDIIDSQTAGTRAILDYLCQEKISDLQTENQSLRLAASQSAQNNYLISQLRPCPQPAYLTCNPFTGQTYAYGNYGQGCGCNTGCGCC